MQLQTNLLYVQTIYHKFVVGSFYVFILRNKSKLCYKWFFKCIERTNNIVFEVTVEAGGKAKEATKCNTVR